MKAQEAYKLLFGKDTVPKRKQKHKYFKIKNKKYPPKYHEYIKSKAWRAVQRRQPNKFCDVCGIKKNLQLHHLTYKRLGRELPKDLIWLCRDHHEGLHFSDGEFSNRKSFQSLEIYKMDQYVKTLSGS